MELFDSSLERDALRVAYQRSLTKGKRLNCCTCSSVKLSCGNTIVSKTGIFTLQENKHLYNFNYHYTNHSYDHSRYYLFPGHLGTS